MTKPTPFQEWWGRRKPTGIFAVEDIAHAAWIAALEHARELMREEETE